MGLLERLRTTRWDAALAVLLTVAGLLQSWLFPIAAAGVAVVYVLGSTLPLAWRRTHPVESALVSSAFWLIPLDGYPVLGFVAVVLQFFALGRHGAPRVAVWATTGWAATVSVVGTLLGPEPPVAAIGAVIAVVAPTVAGRLVWHQHAQNEALSSLTRELREERRRAEAAAVGAERARIAQELHDVVGHELTLIAIQAEAAALALRVQPDRAAEPVETIRATAHRALDEMRTMTDVLAPVTGEATLAGGLVELADRARAAGVPNTLTVSGMPDREPTATSLAVHRVVRECLTNAGRHTPGRPVSLVVEWAPHEVVVTATNPDGGGGEVVPGRGLTGIRHRAELLGGTYSAGRRDGRFEVRVTLPTTGTARA